MQRARLYSVNSTQFRTMLNQAELNRAKRLRVYKICRLQVHVYNCFKLYLQFNIVLLFAICLEVFI